MVILLPPAAPITSMTFLFSSTTTVGHIEDKGLLPGSIKFAGDAVILYKFVIFGKEKSSISLLRIIPVLLDANFAPKLK